MTAPRSLVIAVLLAACGGDGGGNNQPDAPDTTIDAAIPVDAAVTPCGYTEQLDATNNSTTSPELTTLTFATPTVLCGSYHAITTVPSNELVDLDVYQVTVAADSDVLLHVTGAGAETLDDVTIRIFKMTTPVALGVFEGDHGTLAAHLTAGDYLVLTAAFNATPTTAIDYRLTLVADTPATRCAKVTAAANYTEANDGGANDGNDVIRYDEVAMPTKSLTPSTTDAPEPTALTLAAGTQYRITGDSANVNPTDSYMDRDTYEITTGATTTQLSIRLNWSGTVTDLDYLMFRQNSVVTFAGGLDSMNMEDEFETLAVKPNTSYWLWIGAYNGSTAVGYDASICAETYAP